MQVIAKPKPILPPFMKKACLECTNSCPNWCYDGLFPPIGPPPPLTFPKDTSYKNTPTFSPLVIAIIGILASAFLLVSYYAIISKYCGNSQRRREVQNNEEIVHEDFAHSARLDPRLHEPWIIVTPGLDEALIKSITMVKYKKGDGLVGSSDCSVCLGEFLEDETLRLLPKCSHAFHVACIDTWLRSHSNCPLCRANIISTFATNQPLLDNNSSNNDSVLSRRYGVWNQPLLNNNSSNNNSVWSQSLLNNNSDNSVWSHQSWNQSLYDSTIPPLVVDNNGDSVVQDNNTLVITQGENENFSSIEEGRQVGFPQTNGNLPKSNEFRALSDLGVRCYGARDTIRRSVSMDHQHEIYKVSIPDIVRYNLNEKDSVVKFIDFKSQSLNLGPGESSKVSFCSSDGINEMLNCVHSSVAMKRSFSSGRFSFTKQGKENT